MERRREHVLDRPALDDLARVHDEDVVGDIARARKVVGHVEKRDPVLLLELRHQVQDPDADRDVEHADRLVREDDLRLDRERAGDRDPLPLAARELVRILGGDVLRRDEPDRAQQLVHPLLDLARRDDLVDPKRTLDVVAHRLDRIERAEGVLEDDLDLRAVVKDVAPPPDVRDVAPLEQDLPCARLGQVREQPRDGALPAAALADERRDRARAQLERHVVDGVDVRPANRAPDREMLRQAPHLERGCCGHSTPSATRWHATSCPASTCGASAARSSAAL